MHASQSFKASKSHDFYNVSRMLNGSSKSGFQLKSPGMITWYCLIATLVVPFFLCSFYMWYTKCRSQRRAQMTLDREREMEDDLVLSRIEANVQIYSEAEKYRRTKMARVAIREHVKVRRRWVFCSCYTNCWLMIPNLHPYSSSRKQICQTVLWRTTRQPKNVRVMCPTYVAFVWKNLKSATVLHMHPMQFAGMYSMKIVLFPG
jgi:hypothetical protein